MFRYTIPVMVVSMKKKGPCNLPLLRAQNTFGLSRTRSRETWIFAAPDPAVVGIASTTDMKCALITENYGVQKFSIVLYPLKHLHTEFLTTDLICIRKVLNDG